MQADVQWMGWPGQENPMMPLTTGGLFKRDVTASSGQSDMVSSK